MLRLLFLLLGGFYGGLVAHDVFSAPLLNSPSGEGAIGHAMWFWFGGWKVLVAYDVAGALCGMLVSVPLIILGDDLLFRLEDRIVYGAHRAKCRLPRDSP